MFFTKSECSSLAKWYARNEWCRRWSSPSGDCKLFFIIDPELQSRLPQCVPRYLETLYHRLRLNVAYTNNLLFYNGQTTDLYCDNCGAVASLEHILLGCPACKDERHLYKMNLVKLDQGPLTLKTWPRPSKQRSALDLCLYTQLIDLLSKLWLTHVVSSRLWFYFILHSPSTCIAWDTCPTGHSIIRPSFFSLMTKWQRYLSTVTLLPAQMPAKSLRNLQLARA